MKNIISKFSLRNWKALSLCFISLALLVGSMMPVAYTSQDQSNISFTLDSTDSVAVRAAGRGNPWINLGDGRDVPTTYAAASGLEKTLRPGAAKARSLASADFNEDGAADMVSGYAAGASGIITLHLGNRDAFTPQSARALRAISKGKPLQPFLRDAKVFEIPQAPEFLGAGDFNRDGHQDVLTAARGNDALLLLAGDGRGGFSPARRVSLPGQVTAMVTGDINQQDGAADLAVSIIGPQGPAVLVYDSAAPLFATEPASYGLHAEATAMALGQLDYDTAVDLALVAGGEVVIIRGSAQGAKSLDGVERLSLPFTAKGIALGEFIWDRDNLTEMAILAEGGSVHVMTRGEIDRRPFTRRDIEARVEALKQRDYEWAARQRSERRRELMARRQSKSDSWQQVDSFSAGASLGAGLSPQSLLVSARLSGQATDDLLALDSSNKRLNLLTMAEGRTRSRGELQAASIGGHRSQISLDVESAPVAVLPMRLNFDGQPDLVVLREGALAPSAIVSTSAVTFQVTKTADTNDGACDTDCSLREAIVAANATPGADTIVFNVNGTFTLTIAGQFEDASAEGDLDITEAVTIVGNGTANTIIQAGATTATAIDRVLQINPNADATFTTTISGVTIQNGKPPSFDVGGAILHDGFNFNDFTGDGEVILNNCKVATSASDFEGGGIFGRDGKVTLGAGTEISGNSTARGDGGGVFANRFAIAGASGSPVVITNNLAQKNANGNFGQGGGAHAGADQVINISHATITTNNAQNDGGGIRLVSAASITNSQITGNTAGRRGGGLASAGGATSVTLSIINGNTAATDGGGASLTGGSLNINRSNITSNSAVAQGGGVFNNNGTLTLSFNRIVGNAAGDAASSGLRNNSLIGSLTNNWWGCNDDPASGAGCDRVAGTGVTHNPWLTLNHTANPSSLTPGGTATLTADFLTNSAGAAIAAIDLVALEGVPVTFHNAVNGAISNAQPTIANGAATATFTADASPSGNGSADATVDNATVTATIIINVPPAITCPQNVTVNTDQDACTALVSFAATATGSPQPTITYQIGSTVITSPHNFPIGTTTVTATASNGVAPDATCSFTVTVNNPPPTLGNYPTTTMSPGGMATVMPDAAPADSNGTVVNLTASAPGFAGTFSGNATTGAITILNANPPGSYTVTVTATDNCGATTTTTFILNVNNPPTITGATISRQQGAPASISQIATVNDADQAENTLVVTVNGGASATVNGVTVNNISVDATGIVTASVVASCTAFNASFTLTVTDDAGASANATLTVNVTPDTVPPVIVCPPNQTVNTDAGICMAMVTYPDPSASDNCGTVAVVCTPASGSILPVGLTTVNCKATDASGNMATCSFTVTVTNPAPVVTITGPPSGALFEVGTTVNFTATFTDDNAGGAYTGTWQFTSNILNLTQAATIVAPSGSTPGTADASFTFTSAGVYLVTLTVTDTCGDSGFADTVGGLTAMVVVYDPDGGFVTGGGWINSPAGAYVPDPSLTGKASFGFVSKYKPGRSVPDGNTEFQFRAASFNFKSTEYEFLVIAGAKATFKGTGTVNGQGNYEFTLHAIDGQQNGGGGVDKFRIRIKDKNNNNQVIYDNEITNGENDDPTTTLGGGSIVIHNN
jgi:CSLREA domain-containing protein